MKKIRWITIGFMLLLCIGGTYYFLGRMEQQKKLQGVQIINPDYPEEIEGVSTCINNKELKEYTFTMNNKRWGNDNMGNSSVRIKEKGDLLCCLAMATSMADKTEIVTPSDVNTRLKEINAIDKNGDICVDKLSDVFVDFQECNDLQKLSKEEGFLKNPGDNELVRDVIKVEKDGEFRWVFIAGLTNKGKEYLVLDPREEKATNMSDYDNYVYAWYTLGRLKIKENSDSIKLKKPVADMFWIYPKIKKKDKMYTFDTNWSDIKLENSNNTIGMSGDLICCLATVTSALSEHQTTPDEVNLTLLAQKAYDENGEVDVSKLQDVLTYFVNHDIMNEALYDDSLSQGEIFQIVKVIKNGKERWVVVEGTTEDACDYKIFDPQEKSTKGLKEYGSIIYGWYSVGAIKNA